MLNPEIAAIAADLVDGALAGRDLNLHMQIRAKQNFLASKGYAMSGAAIHEIAKLANEELRTVFATTWTALINSLKAMPPKPDPDLKDNLQKLFADMIEQRHQTILGVAKPAFKTSGDGHSLGVSIVQPIYEGLKKQYAAEIALWAATYQNSTQGQDPAQASYSFHGPVGSVQTGDLSTARVVQNIGSSDLASLISAVQSLVVEINSRADIDKQSKASVGKLTDAIERELQSPERSEDKLRGLFFGLSAFVQAMAAAPQAYAVMESIAVNLGFL